jgi:hypothetical protein
MVRSSRFGLSVPVAVLTALAVTAASPAGKPTQVPTEGDRR